MSHSNKQPYLAEDHEDPDGWATWAIGIGSTFLMIATVAIACGIYYRAATAEAKDKHVNIRYEQRDMVMAAQQAAIEESARWVSRINPSDAGAIDKLVVPINLAMEIVAEKN